MRKIEKTARTLLAWFGENARDLPWRRTRDPYAIWISEIMLQQTQVQTVIPYWNRWLEQLPNLQALAHADANQVLKLWEGLGYYSRARNLQKAAQIILSECGGQFPQQADQLLRLPGIGRYTAGAICSIAFNQPAPILDGNAIRVLARLFALEGNPKEKLIAESFWRLSERLVRAASQSSFPRSASHFNQALMELGATICIPQNPPCASCPLRRLCLAFREKRVMEFPALPSSPPATPRHFVSFIVASKNKYLAGKRPAGGVNAHLWEFPNLEIEKAADPETAALELFGMRPASMVHHQTIKHSITRYRITLDAYHLTFPRRAAFPKLAGCWYSLEKLGALPFSSAHKKILLSLPV
jgi:A/G-specific adenine glycosylase